MHTRTWQFPRLGLVEVDDGDDLELDLEVVDLALEVVGDELLVRGVEAEARREGGGLRGRRRRGGGGGVGHARACCC